MSDQKPVKRDEAWLDSAMHLMTEYAIASGEYLTTGTRDDVDPFVKARRAVFEHLTAPDPRDACVDALRLARAALEVSTTHLQKDREKVVAARIATESALRALDGDKA